MRVGLRYIPKVIYANFLCQFSQTLGLCGDKSLPVPNGATTGLLLCETNPAVQMIWMKERSPCTMQTFLSMLGYCSGPPTMGGGPGGAMAPPLFCKKCNSEIC